MPSLTRRVTFTATHRYWRSDWSAERNATLFGAAAIAHAHDYLCDVTVSGPIDADTGMIVDLGRHLGGERGDHHPVLLQANSFQFAPA